MSFAMHYTECLVAMLLETYVCTLEQHTLSDSSQNKGYYKKKITHRRECGYCYFDGCHEQMIGNSL